MTKRKETPAEFRERMRSIGFMKGGRPRDRKVVETKMENGVMTKATTDEVGNTVTEWNTKDDRVDVEIHPKVVTLKNQRKQ